MTEDKIIDFLENGLKLVEDHANKKNDEYGIYFAMGVMKTQLDYLKKLKNRRKWKMYIETPYGLAKVPDELVDRYKDLSDEKLLEELDKSKKYVDPILIQILKDKSLIGKNNERVYLPPNSVIHIDECATSSANR